MNELELVKTWIQGYPGLGALQVDTLGGRPGDCGLFPQGIRVLQAQEDVQGNRLEKCRLTFSLRRVFYRQEEAAVWCLGLQNWVWEQCAMGLVPQLGEKTGTFRAERGRMTKLQAGAATYEVVLTAEFFRRYEHGKN